MFLTTARVAERLGCSVVSIVKAIKSGRLTAQKAGKDWIIINDDKYRLFEEEIRRNDAPCP
jgi:excisionase family DNA binding protein